MHKKKLLLFIAVPVILTISACGKQKLDTTREKYSYAIGHQIGNNMKKQGIDIDVKSFNLAAGDVINGNKGKYDPKELEKVSNEINLIIRRRIENPQGAKQIKEEFDEYFKKDRERCSYAIGNQIIKNVLRQGIDIDVMAFSLAMEESVKGDKSSLTLEEMRNAMKEMAQNIQKRNQNPQVTEKIKKEGEEYLVKNRKKNGVVVTASGLQYEVLKKGAGSRPKVTDRVKVNYRGTLINGSEFDSSYKRNKPAVFAVNRLIPGWTEALQLMNVGSKYKLTIPSELAYGTSGNPGIPPNSVLIFELELLGIVK